MGPHAFLFFGSNYSNQITSILPFLSLTSQTNLEYIVITAIRTSAAYHPQTQGVVESFNGTIKSRLDLSSTTWDVEIEDALFAYNRTFHGSIKCRPYEVFFGREFIPEIGDLDISGEGNFRNINDLSITHARTNTPFYIGP